MKTRVLIIIIIAGSVSTILFSLNYHVEYSETESAYAFCEQFLFDNRKTCTIIWQKPDCPSGGCIIPKTLTLPITTKD